MVTKVRFPPTTVLSDLRVTSIPSSAMYGCPKLPPDIEVGPVGGPDWADIGSLKSKVTHIVRVTLKQQTPNRVHIPR